MSKEKKRFKEAGGVIPGDMGPVQILELGIYNEISARDFYLSVAQQIRDASGREKFEFLANDEKRHKKILEDWYKKESGGRDFPFDSKKVETIKAEVKDHTSAFEAIDLAQEAERQAYLFYQEAAKRTNDEKGKEMFQRLAEEEEGHYQKLSAERNAIAGGFYWFGLDQAAPLED
jgi:rubrerythrin